MVFECYKAADPNHREICRGYISNNVIETCYPNDENRAWFILRKMSHQTEERVNKLGQDYFYFCYTHKVYFMEDTLAKDTLVFCPLKDEQSLVPRQDVLLDSDENKE